MPAGIRSGWSAIQVFSKAVVLRTQAPSLRQRRQRSAFQASLTAKRAGCHRSHRDGRRNGARRPRGGHRHRAHQQGRAEHAGFEYPGHTEFLEALTGAPRAVMMLASDQLRVVPLTIHTPLSLVPAAITSAAIVETGEIILASLKKYFGIAVPRLAVSGTQSARRRRRRTGQGGNQPHRPRRRRTQGARP